jgi:Copper binding periplasmic protein CusF
MKTAISMTTMLSAVMVALSLGSAALAEDAQGVVTQVDRINSTVAIRQTQSGTVGANPGAAEEYKAPGLPLDDLHAGDGVTFSATETGGVKTLTKIDRR